MTNSRFVVSMSLLTLAKTAGNDFIIILKGAQRQRFMWHLCIFAFVVASAGQPPAVYSRSQREKKERSVHTQCLQFGDISFLHLCLRFLFCASYAAYELYLSLLQIYMPRLPYQRPFIEWKSHIVLIFAVVRAHDNHIMNVSTMYCYDCYYCIAAMVINIHFFRSYLW